MERNLRLLSFGAVIRAFGLSLIGPFFALYLYNVLNIGYEEIGILIVLIGVPPLFLSPLGGLLTDRFGRRRLFLLSLAGEAVVLFTMAAAMTLASLLWVIVTFAVFAVVSTVGGPALSAYVADLAFGSERTIAFTWFRIGHNVGFTLGVLAGGALVGVFGFVPVALLSAVAATGAVLFVAALIEPSPYDRELATGARLDGSPHMAPGSVRHSIQVLAKDRTFLVLCLGFALSYVATAQWQVTFPLFVHQRMGVSYVLLGAGFALNGVVVVLGQAPTTRYVLGRRHTTIAIAGTLCYVAAFLGLGLFGALDLVPEVAFFAAVFVLTIGENLLSIPMSTLPSNLSTPEEVGAYNGVFQTLTGVGPLVAIFFGGVILATVADPLLLWVILMVPAVPAVLLLRWGGLRAPAHVDRA